MGEPIREAIDDQANGAAAENHNDFYRDNQEFSERLNNLIDAEGRPTHTQELRRVLRRDIVRRDGTSPQSPAYRENGAVAPAGFAEPERRTVRDNPGEFAREDARLPTRETPDDFPGEPSADRHNERSYHDEPRGRAVRPPALDNDFDFDDSDWDYEPPAGPSKWKWILPAACLVLVALASLIFVNRPDFFATLTASGPDMTIDTALERADAKLQSGELIFPEGQSALDYYRLILQSEPDNAQALNGIDSIGSKVRAQIVKHVDEGNLSAANRLLSRANASDLQIDIQGEASNSSEARRAIAIDNTASPWVKNQIEDIESLLAAGDFKGAQNLFDDVDKFIADAELSASIRQRIEEGINTSENNASGTAVVPSNDSTVVVPVDNSAIVAESDTFAAVTTEAEFPAPADLNNTDAAVIADTTPAIPEPAIPEVEQKIAPVVKSDTLPSAPRRSFIEGNDATAQHLNQLRLALEAKNLQRVLSVSQSLPGERTDFLRRLFQRYDRLDVTIDDINRNGNNATAKLSVAMFNQRTDGSFYSAGKWSDVELAVSRNNGEWQPIIW